jgi:hypothetical protein
MTSHCVARFLATSMMAMPLLLGAAKARSEGEAGASEAEARAHFTKGDGHLKKGEYPEAHEAFRKSLAAKRTRGTMAAVASALKQLGRYDEALTFYEQALREFPRPPAGFEAKVSREIKELEALVGTMSVAGDAPAGATLSVDNVVRGKLPLAAPLRVAQGTHEIRVDKEGFDPITANVEVRAGKEAVVQLVAPSKKGRLVVGEKHGWPLAVEVDGKDVGVTPWEGPVEPGEHRVKLHGLLAEEALVSCEVPGGGPGENARAKEPTVLMESPVQTASVRLYEVTRMVLGAEDQDASLKIESTPKGARVWIDAKLVGPTPWEGRRRLGKHTIEVEARGFFTAFQEVTLERRKQRDVTIVLERKPDLSAIQREMERARTVRNASAGVSYGLAGLGLGVGAVTGVLTLAKVGEIRDRCGGPTCPRNQQPAVDAARTLSAVSTAGFVLGGLGVVAGTVALLTLEPKRPEQRGGGASHTNRPVWRVGAGPGRFEIEGRF